MPGVYLSGLEVRPLRSRGKGALATASLEINGALRIDGVHLVRGAKGLALKWPVGRGHPLALFASELFQRTLLHRIWMDYHRLAVEAQND